MYKITYSGKYKKDYRLMKKRGYDMKLLKEVVVEIIQLLLCRGLMEFDDVIHNSVGAALGFGAFAIE